MKVTAKWQPASASSQSLFPDRAQSRRTVGTWSSTPSETSEMALGHQEWWCICRQGCKWGQKFDEVSIAQSQLFTCMALKHDAIDSSRIDQVNTLTHPTLTTPVHWLYSISFHSTFHPFQPFPPIPFYSFIFQSIPHPSTLFQSLPFRRIDHLSHANL